MRSTTVASAAGSGPGEASTGGGGATVGGGAAGGASEAALAREGVEKAALVVVDLGRGDWAVAPAADECRSEGDGGEAEPASARAGGKGRGWRRIFKNYEFTFAAGEGILIKNLLKHLSCSSRWWKLERKP
jgi:hypothetical protein